jgi:hypothetical protein
MGTSKPRRRETGRSVGRPRTIDPAVEALIVRWRSRGASIRRIVRELQAAGHPTPSGGGWQYSTVQRVVDRHPELARGPSGPKVIVRLKGQDRWGWA